ncbi:MAG: alkaline shock response membrane anchor protein AmaP [Fusobacteriaceae bacterium]
MKKIIFFIAWTGILFISLIGVISVVYPSFFNQFNLSPFMLKMLILNISIIYIFIVFAKISSKLQKEKDYEIKTENGKIIVSSETIKTLIFNTLLIDPDINVKKVETSKNYNKFNIKIFLESNTNKNISEKSLFIQENIKKSIKNSTGVDINEVEIKITKFINQV